MYHQCHVCVYVLYQKHKSSSEMIKVSYISHISMTKYYRLYSLKMKIIFIVFKAVRQRLGYHNDKDLWKAVFLSCHPFICSHKTRERGKDQEMWKRERETDTENTPAYDSAPSNVT